MILLLLDGMIYRNIVASYEIIVYETEDGDVPYDNWFLGLDDKAAQWILTAVARMEVGNLGDIKPVGKGVHERRIRHRPEYRIYFGLDGNKVVILLTGGTKKRQSRDINLAQEYWADYMIRKVKLNAPHTELSGYNQSAG